eukprot:3136116-Rhodomonas_salina.2
MDAIDPPHVRIAAFMAANYAIYGGKCSPLWRQRRQIRAITPEKEPFMLTLLPFMLTLLP